MKLHEFPSEFRDLISIVAKDKHLPESAIERDYDITKSQFCMFSDIRKNKQ